MNKVLQLRRGSTTQHSNFAGHDGEITIDTTSYTPVVHDGNTLGGHPVASKAYVDSALSGKIDTATTLSGYGITDAYTQTQINNLLNTKADLSIVYTQSQVTNILTGYTTLSSYNALSSSVNYIIAGTQSILYDNTISGLSSTTIKMAIDEIAGNYTTNTTFNSTINSIIDGTQAITYDNTISGLSSTTIKTAIDELQANKLSTTLANSTYLTQTNALKDYLTNVSNIAALKGMTPTSGEWIYVRGYYNDGDLGDGIFYPLTGAANGTYTDDGGYTILPIGGNGSSCWRRVFSFKRNLKEWGAVGDDTTDDSTAIINAVNYCANNGVKLIVPPGTFLLTQEITLTGIEHFTMHGTGGPPIGTANTPGTTSIIHATGYNGQHFYNVDCHGFDIQNMMFSGEGINGSDAVGGFFFNRANNGNTANHYFKNVLIAGVTNDALAMSAPIMSVFDNVTCVDVSGNGFNLYGGTSVTMNSCYGITTTKAGFSFTTMTYFVLNGCASESSGVGFDFVNSKGICNGCGVESMVNRSTSYPGSGFRTSGEIVTLIECYTRAITTQGEPLSRVNGGDFNIIGFYDNDKGESITSPKLLKQSDAFPNFIIKGLNWNIPFTDSLTSSMTSGEAYIDGWKAQVQSDQTHTFTASQDTYVAIDQFGNLTYQNVANGASAPAPPIGSVNIHKVVTNSTTVSSVINLISVGPGIGPSVFNVESYGAYSGSQSTHGTMTAGSNQLTLTSAIDFENGQGICVYHAGPGPYQVGTTTALATPAAPTGTVNGTAGTTTYTYNVVAMDDLGGSTTASPTLTISTGNATLSSTNNIALNVASVTGVYMYAWYRNGTLFEITDASSITDSGQSVSYAGVENILVTSSVPTHSSGQNLITRIVSGAGTTTLTLADSSVNAITNKAVHHDNSLAFQQALDDAANVSSQSSYSVPLVKAGTGQWNISQPIKVPAYVKLDVLGSFYFEIPSRYTFGIQVLPHGRLGRITYNANGLTGISIGTKSTLGDNHAEFIRAHNVGNLTNSTYSSSQSALYLSGYGHDIGTVQLTGGDYGLELNAATDVRISRAIAVSSKTSLKITGGSEQVFISSIQLDSPTYTGAQIDSCAGVYINARLFLNDANNTAALSSGYGVEIGKYSSSHPITGLQLDININNVGGTAVYLDYVNDIRLRGDISNNPLGSGNSYPIQNGIEYTVNTGNMVDVEMSVNVPGSAYLGTPAGKMLLSTPSGDIVNYKNGITIKDGSNTILESGTIVNTITALDGTSLNAAFKFTPYPTGSASESTAIYSYVDPTGTHTRSFAHYIDVTSNQTNGEGGAIKINHYGSGDAIYVDLQNNGFGMESAQYVDGGTGFLASFQKSTLVNSTGFQALWNYSTIPAYGLFFAAQSSARAFTVQSNYTGDNGYAQICLFDTTMATLRFGVFNDGHTKTNAPITNVAGATAGNVYWTMPEQGSAKKFVASVVGYENNSTTNLTITFPTAFKYPPAVSLNTTGLTVSASTTTLTITAPNNTTLYTGIIKVEGI